MLSHVPLTLMALPTMLVIAYSASCRTEFEFQKVCPLNYGFVLNQIGNVPSPIACDALCASDVDCRSCTYDSSTNDCQTNSMTNSSFPSGCDVEVHYAELVKATCRDTWLIHPCTSDVECSVPNSACLNSICSCQNAYSYQHRTDSCLAFCPEYGATFKEEDYYLYGNNDAILTGMTVDQCKDACLSFNTTCRFFEYEFSTTDCYISTNTGMTKPNDYLPEDNPDWVQFLRNCA